MAKELSLKQKIEQCQGCTITVNLLGVYKGSEKLKKTDLIPFTIKQSVTDRSGEVKTIIKTVEINHKDREHTICTKNINLQPYQIKAITEDCPNNVDPRRWKGMPIEKRFLHSVSLFDEGYGVEASFIL